MWRGNQPNSKGIEVPVNNAGARAHIIAVGQIPPPVTGYAYITARMIETLGENADVETIDISPGHRQGLRKHLHKALQTARACWRLARPKRPQFVYLGCEGDWGLIYTAALVLTSRLLGYPLLLHHHSFSYIDRSSSLMKFILGTGGKKISHVFLCPSMRDRFEARYGRLADSRIVSNAAFVEGRGAPRGANSAASPLCIGLLSNLTREKGLYTFIDLLRRLRKSDLDFRALLAGPITNAEDRAAVAAAEAELGVRLKYLGALYGDAKDAFYRDIDVFVFPTHYANEAEPTVLFEALAAGNLIVAYDRGCIGSQIGKRGLAVPTAEDFCTRAFTYLATLLGDSRTATLDRQTIAHEFLSTKSSALLSAQSLTSRSPSQTTNTVRSV